jgi:hypothetical protein
MARALARDGCIDEEIADYLGVSVKTLNAWKIRYPEFKEALKGGKLEIDLLVEDSLLKRALGYEYKETEVKKSPDGVTKKRSRKHMAPDVTAQIFWLKNRQPERWRDKQDVNLGGEVAVNDGEKNIIEEIAQDPALAQKIRENYRRRMGKGPSPE